MERSDCLFCRIADKKEPGEIIWEDEKYLAFLDKFPKEAGHTLVIPKAHTDYVFNLPEAEYVDLMKAVWKVAAELKKTREANHIFMKAIGTDVAHVHIHLIPHAPTA
jgi:histidine triad (HIT) family protein